MKCPKCKNALLQKSGTVTRIRTKGPLVFAEDGKCMAKCYWCGEPVFVPLELRKSYSRFIVKRPEVVKTPNLTKI